jgi:hypothetical protein
MKSLKKLTFNVYNCPAVAVFVLYHVSSQTAVWAASYIRRCRKLWRRRSVSKRGQMLKGREKRSKISSFVDGEK